MDCVDRWLGHVARSTAFHYRTVLDGFCRALNVSPDVLLDEARGDGYFALDLVQDYVQARQGTKNYKEYLYNVLQSFFIANRCALPRDKFRIRGDKIPVVPRLTVEDVRSIALMAGLRDRSMIMCGWAGLMGCGELAYMNTQWESVKKQFDNDLIRIDFPQGRKGNMMPYYALIGGDALTVLREYVEKVRGSGDGYIWETKFHTPVTRPVYQSAWRTLTVRLMLRPARGQYGSRYGVNIHEMRDLARSVWHKSGADKDVAEFLMGHVVDRNKYDKIYNLDPEWVREEYRKALPYLNLISGEAANRQQQDKVRMLEERLAKLETIYMEKVLVKE